MKDREEYISILEQDNAELKSQLKGTTHCFDEEEHKRLSEQLELLTSKLDEYDLITDERNQLKKQLEEKKMLIKQCDLSISKVMDCYCERTDCSGRIKDSKQYDSLVQKVETQQKEFINYLEDKIYSIEPKGTGINYNCEYDSEEDYAMAMQEQSRLNTLKEILQKYKEIIGVSDESR